MAGPLGALTVTAVAALLLGGLTGLVAASKGRSLWAWAVVGAVLPVAGLVVVMAAVPDRSPAHSGPSDEAVAATRRSAVARALAATGPATREDLADRTALAHRRVRLELSGLRDLGMARRSEGVWQLSADGAAALDDVGSADDPIAGAVAANATAGTLVDGSATAGDVARRAGLGRRQARLQLAGLAGLDVAARDDDGRWRLTARGRRLLADRA